jgi:purine-binding chemotaxis protein CheW
VPETKELRLIAFRTGAETFVIDIMSVRQILPFTGSTSIPTAPSFVEGIMILRNQVIPVIDLRDRLQVNESLRSKKPLVLITETTAGTIGLKVDEVKRILNVRSDALLPPPPLVRGIRGELLVAIVHHEKEVYLLIDVESVLSIEEKTELQSAELSVPASEGASDR